MITSKKAFSSHILRYVGVGLISGSIVHAGTLGGGLTRYVILMILGIFSFAIGTYLEHQNKIDKKFLSFILISIAVSIGTGMVSGGTQHYLDGPVYASLLLPLGLLIAYTAFMYRDFKNDFSLKKISVAVLLCTALGASLYSISHSVPTLSEHHGEAQGVTQNHTE